MGFNCAEAVNFALKNWVSYGEDAGYCKCQKDSVKIDMIAFNENLQNQKEFAQKINVRKPHVISSPLQNVSNICKNVNNLPKKILNKKTQMDRGKKSPKVKRIIHENEIENWLSCDSCDKWRKLPNSN